MSHNDPSNIVCVTQNVRGLAKNDEALILWFSGLRQKRELGQADVVFLQETRATSSWTSRLRDQHAREWGFRPEQLGLPLSYWQSTPTAAGGVAILLKPNGIVQDQRPLWEERWSPWFTAVTATVLGKPVIFVNVYAPSGKPRAREQFFTSLLDCALPPGQILLGGDFNCTLDGELDRSRPTSQSTDSPALHALLQHWNLVDAAMPDMAAVITQAEKVEFHARHHTYQYQYPDGSFASSRLDRWYVGEGETSHVAGLRVDPPVNESDHNSVTLRYSIHGLQRHGVRRRRPRLRYPLPFGCQNRLTQLTTTAVTAFAERYVDSDGAISACAWDELKTAIRRASLIEIRVILRRQKKGIRQRYKRLQAALKAALYAAAPRLLPLHADVETITAGIDSVSLDPTARVASLRRAIVRLERRRTRSRRRRTFAAYAAGTPAAERAFFRRFSLRQGHRGPVTLPSVRRTSGSVADQLAEDWSTVTQRGSTEKSARDAIFAELPTPATLPVLDELDCAFTEAEVRASLLSCPRGKAAGPDGLPNDWYRDHADLLVPVLTQLYNRWHRQRTLPSSFRHATVACLPKTPTPQSGLDFRPIALLDTDYKIYSRLLLNRLNPRMPELVAPTQFGFVAGRQVHDALDVFHGIQALVRSGHAPSSAVAVLLDFAKAYDTLDRCFLLQVLDRLGLPVGFRDAVEQMHLHTTAEYVAEDSISTTQLVSNGIRQGCPLAPTLFVLAVNTLYEILAGDPKVHGVRLQSGEEVCATGYADDTTCYLEDAASAGPLKAALDRFGAASGLHVNVRKCVVVFLGEDDGVGVRTQTAFPAAPPSVASRLLGGQVATEDVSATTWTLTLQQVRARLHWAELKTTNESQRVKLLRSVLLPKFLFVARHSWPSATTIEKFQRLIDDYVWGGGLAADGNRKRAWISKHVARAPVAAGGLDIPNLTHELQVLSLHTVDRWARPGVLTMSEIGRVRLSSRSLEDGLLAPSRRPGTLRLSLQPTLAATGLQIRRALSPTPRDARELDLLQPLLRHVGRGSSADYHWDHGWLVADYARDRDLLLPLQHHQGHHHGNLLVSALLRARVCGEDILVAATSTPVTVASFPGLFRAGDRIEDIVDVAWDASGRIRFRAVNHDAPLLPLLAVQFRRFCDTLVFNFPGILRPPAQPEDLVLRPPTLDVWRLRAAPTGYTLEWSPLASAVVSVGAVSSTAEATRVARRITGVPTCWFESHTWLDPPFALWAGVKVPSSTTVRDLLRQHDEARCDAEQLARQRRWEQQDPSIATALAAVAWGPLMATAGAPAAHRLLFHKLKGARLSGWDRIHERPGCPHCPALGAAGGSVFHIAWACPRAQDRWRQLLEFWAPLDLAVRELHSDQVKSDVFGLKLRTLPAGLWCHRDITRLGEPSAHDTVSIGYALTSIWRRQVLSTLYIIWRWRTSPDTLDEIWSDAHARARHGASLRAVFTDVCWDRAKGSEATKFTAAAVDALLSSALTDAPPPIVSSSLDDHFVLFFDGGSRGNPGPGGSGAVVVRVDARSTCATVVWSAASALESDSTTNNQAEYHGLLTGLQAAREHNWLPLEVVGDSQLVLRQMEMYRPPRNAALLELYAPARRLADTLKVREWTHHPRAYNSMADAAANEAMDSATTSTEFHPTTHAAHARIASWLMADFAHWQVRHLAT